MKKILFLFTILLISNLGFAQNKLNFKEYTVTEFFKMIEDAPTDTLYLKNAYIFSDDNPLIGDIDWGKDIDKDWLEDKDLLHIHKHVNLENVVFLPFQKYGKALQKIIFHKKPLFINVLGDFKKVRFENGVKLRYNGRIPDIIDYRFNDDRNNIVRSGSTNFYNCFFDKDPNAMAINAGNDNFILMFQYSTFKFNSREGNVAWIFEGLGRCFLRNNNFLGNDFFGIFLPKNNSDILIENNDFGDRLFDLRINDPNFKIKYNGNKHKTLPALSIPENLNGFDVDWNQFKKGIISSDNYRTSNHSEAQLKQYKDSVRIANPEAYRGEIKLLGTLVTLYKKQYNKEFANASYMALKDLETQRLKYLYEENPSFDTYFEWKVNQFLKVFSDYGTKPSKAITMSVYVILLFALVYLFFPNYWDSHGKNRIRDRFLFFHKYLRHPKGIQDVYLDEQKNELELANKFLQILEQHKTEVPKIFYQAAKPLHKWSVAGTMLYARLLTKIDFLKGSWKQTDPKVRVLKTSLTLFIFCIALIYDVFIKMLNALMLSINTFTTLGFGEIPIKGLPRYLAIIQGFIGWFMLTIFSVSLISQLLN